MLADYDAEAIADVLGLTPKVAQVEAVGTPDAGPSARTPISEAAAVLVVSGNALDTTLSPVVIEKLVAAGLLRASLRVVAERIAGDDDDAVARIERAVTSADGDQWARLSVPDSERTERLARLFVQARRSLGTEAEASAFLTSTHPELDGRTPLEATRTDLGARHVERLLMALEYGLAL